MVYHHHNIVTQVHCLMFLPFFFFFAANSLTSVVFLMGHGESVQYDIDREVNTFGDVIQIKGFREDYHNLTLKTAYTIKFFNDKSKDSSHPFDSRNTQFCHCRSFHWKTTTLLDES